MAAEAALAVAVNGHEEDACGDLADVDAAAEDVPGGLRMYCVKARIARPKTESRLSSCEKRTMSSSRKTGAREGGTAFHSHTVGRGVSS